MKDLISLKEKIALIESEIKIISEKFDEMNKKIDKIGELNH